MLVVEPMLVMVEAETAEAQRREQVQERVFLTEQGMGTQCEGQGMRRVGLGDRHLLRQPSEPAAS